MVAKKILTRLVSLRMRQAFIMMVLMLASWGLATSISYGQTQGWSQPIPLSSTDPSSWFPDIAVDPTGRVHVVWSSFIKYDTNKKFDAVMYTTSQDGQEWTEAVDIAAPEMQFGEATRPTLYTDQLGNLHITYRGYNVYYSRAPLEDTGVAASWLPPNRINLSQVAYFSRLAADSQGRLHLILTENVITPECELCYHVFYRHSDNNGLAWSAISEISLIPTGAAKPQILVDPQDNLHVVWEAGEGGSYGQILGPSKVMYAASYDRGKSWTPPVEFLTPGRNAKNITIGLDSQNRLLVAWLGVEGRLVYYQLSSDQGRSWSQPRTIPGVIGGGYGSNLDSYTMATDSAGNIHLVMVGSRTPEQTSYDLLHLVWDGATWSAPEVITTLFGDGPEWPRLAIGKGNQLHVVWFVRDEAHLWESDKQEYQIWYAHGWAEASEETVEVASTPTPLPALTLTPTPTSTPLPLPTVDSDIAHLSVPAGATDTIYTEVDDVVLLLQSLLPAILIVAFILIGWRIRQR